MKKDKAIKNRLECNETKTRRILRRLILSFAILAFLLPSGCVVIPGTTKEWRIDDRPHFPAGPGTTFLVRAKNRYEIDDGSRLAVGIVPGMAKTVHDGTNVVDGAVTWCVNASVWNCFAGIPTICSLFFAPFDEGARTNVASQWGLLGCCEWTGSAKTKLIERGVHENIAEIKGPPGPEGAKIAGKTSDGIRLLFEYPGNETMLAELKKHGKVAVAFRARDHKYRIFLPAQHFEGAYTFKDVDLADSGVEMAQIRYYDKAQAVKASVKPLLSHKDLGEKAKATVKSVEGLLTALPSRDEAALAGLEKGVDALARRAHEIAEAEERARRETEACREACAALVDRLDGILRSKSDDEAHARAFDLNGEFVGRMQALREEIVALQASASPAGLQKVDGLKSRVEAAEGELANLVDAARDDLNKIAQCREACAALVDRLDGILRSKSDDEAHARAFDLNGEFVGRVQSLREEIVALQASASPAGLQKVEGLKSRVEAAEGELAKLVDAAREDLNKIAQCRTQGAELRRQVDKLPWRKHYNLVTDEDFRAKVQSLAKRLDACVTEPSPDRFKEIGVLRGDASGLESEFEKLLVSRAERIRAMERSLGRLQVAVVRARDEKPKRVAESESREQEIQSAGANAFARMKQTIEERKLAVSACRQRVAACESEIEWARRLAAPSALAKDSLFARKKPEGAEAIFDELWRDFYTEGRRRTMYAAEMDCRADGTPNVVVGPDERSLDVIVRVSRNAPVHDAWKRKVRDRLGALGLRGWGRAFTFQEDRRDVPTNFVHHVAGRDYSFSEKDQEAFERWRRSYLRQYRPAELFVEMRLLAADGSALLSRRQPYSPGSTHEDGDWPDEILRFSFSADVDSRLLDSVKRVDVNVVDGAEILRRAEELLQRAKEALATAERECAAAQEALADERQKVASQVAAVRKERVDVERKCQKEIEKAEADLKAAEARTEDEWRRILKSEGVK